MGEQVKMPDGSDFAFWDDRTTYRRVLHVAREHPRANDDGPGTEEQPLATIGRAAELLGPGEKAVIHAGIYRETVRPARGGEGPEAMIAYEAAPGERVEVRGSRVAGRPLARSNGWHGALRRRLHLPPDVAETVAATVWTLDLPAEDFVGYNPFLVKNFPAEYASYTAHAWTKEEIARFQLRRGAVYVDGRSLRQVFRVWELAHSDGTFWVEEPGLRIHLRLPGDGDPAGRTIEYTTAEQLFAPRTHGLGYIRVAGIVFSHAADGIPVPQRAAVSTARGHHWIVEDCEIRHANATGLDIGNEDWNRDAMPVSGGHIVRRNHIHHCGICGIAGVHGVNGSLVEDNLIEHIGGRNVEHIYECAGLKFHVARDVLIRRNVFRHLTDACGLWLDVLNANCRITGNVFADIETLLGGVYLECSQERNVVDGNVFWELRDVPTNQPPKDDTPGGIGVSTDCCDNVTVANNLFGNVRGYYAVALHLAQSGRVIGGRVGLSRRHRVHNNVFVHCPRQILLARQEECRCDGNLFAAEDDRASLCIQYPHPSAVLNLAAWQEYYGFDRAGAARDLSGEMDPHDLRLSLRVDGDVPEGVEVSDLHGDGYPLAGPFTPEQWQQLRQGDELPVDPRQAPCPRNA